MQHVNAMVQQTIRKVEKGEFDSTLKKLEGSPLGIYANAYAEEGEVVPMPAGYMQSENALEISVTNEKNTDAIQVGWMGGRSLQSVCLTCTCVHPPSPDGRPLQSIGAYCERWLLHRLPALGRTLQSVGAQCQTVEQCDPDLHAREIDPVAIAQSVEGHADLLANLAMDGLGLFMVHGHTEDVGFVELPAGFMSVIENNKTSFRERESVLNNRRFVPNVWRFENGVRQPVGGFVV